MGPENKNSYIRPEVVEAARSALERVEQTEELSPDDPAMVQVQHTIVRSMAELEIRKPVDASAELDLPQHYEKSAEAESQIPEALTGKPAA